MNTQWRKILGDFSAHRFQVCVIGVVLAVGSAGVVATMNARAILQREIKRSYQSAHAPDVVLWFDKVTPELLEKVRAQPGVSAVDTRHVAFTRAAGTTDKWFPMRLTVLRDFSGQRLGMVHQHGLAWPSDDGIFIEQSGRAMLGLEVGEQLRLRRPTGEIVTLPLAGFVHDTAVAPSRQDRAIYAYLTPDSASLIGQADDFDQLLVRQTESGDLNETTSFAQDLRDGLKAQGENPVRADALSDAHPHAGLMATMLRVLQTFAGIALVCSAALALYLVSVWMKREGRQVGIMKTIGARSHQLAFQYLGLVVPLVLVANAVAFPIGMWLSRCLVRYYQTSFNIDVSEWSPPRSLLIDEVILMLALPLFAMAVPIARAARMTARAAIQDPGIVSPRKTRFSFSRWLKFPGDRRWTFALRNTFRRPGRLTITLIALSAGGALLLTANNTYESLMTVVDVSLGNQGHDIQVQLQRPVPTAELKAAAEKIPEVEINEAWRTAGVTVVSTTGAESSRLLLLGYPTETQLFKLPVKEGRLPFPDETDAVVVNRLVQNAVPGLEIGRELDLHFRDRRAKLRVVGIVEEIGIPALYATYPAFDSVTALGDASSLLRVKIAPGTEEFAATALDQALLDAHLAPANVQTRAEFREGLEQHFAVVTDVMRMIAFAATLLGVISLGASVALSVLERAREIGVVRALGATPRGISAMLLMEAGVVAIMSAGLSVAAGMFLSGKLNQMASRDLLHVAVPLHVSSSGLAILSAGIVIVMIGLWIFLRRMLRVSVRDALAYE